MAQLAALVLLVLGLLPIANWIPGGHDAPSYSIRLGAWINGGGIALGAGVIAAIFFRWWPALWRTGLWAAVGAKWRAAGRRADAAIAIGVLAICAFVARTVLSAKPLLIDEVISLYQARILATGHLWLPAPVYPQFTSAMHLLDWGGKVYGQFPVGGPAMLALGTWAHAEWLVGPVATAVGVYLLARLLRRVPLGDGTALAALLLYAFAPFTLFLGGSMMNHVTETTWLLGGALALVIATASDRARPGAAFAMGLALGVAATIRPTDAAAFALPSAVWLLWRVRLGWPHLRALLVSGVGIAIPVAFLLYVNSQQTGDPFRFGYIAMWGKSHEMGFHAAPWGPAHTPARGLELINLYLLRLQDYLFESAGPSLLFASIALALSTRRNAFDRWVLASSAMLLLMYFAYWHDGFYLGPRFMLPLAPWLALWTARLPAELAQRRVAPFVMRVTLSAGVAALLIGAMEWVPLRAQQYRNGMTTMRIDVDSAAAAAGVHDAVVLVRESWGGQLVAQLWGLGVTRTDAELIYRTIDACQLQSAMDSVDRHHGDAAELRRIIAPYARDSALLRGDHTLPDTTARFLPGAPRTAKCLRRMTEDRDGSTLYPPVMLDHGGGNFYARDLHGSDSLLLAEHPGKAIWLLTKSPPVGSPLRFEHVSVDSMRREWQLDRPELP